jgi:hypothetical protein
MNKQVLIEKLNLSYSNIEHFLSKLTEEQMTEEVVKGGRTPKDIIAHITTWNWNGIEWIKSVAAGENPILQMEGRKLEDRDEVFAVLNEEIHTENQGKTLKEVLADHKQSWATLMTLIKTITQENLDRTIHLEWAANPFPGWTVVAWRMWHADNHMNHIEEWMNKK